jgi:hypothetical protein
VNNNVISIITLTILYNISPKGLDECWVVVACAVHYGQLALREVELLGKVLVQLSDVHEFRVQLIQSRHRLGCPMLEFQSVQDAELDACHLEVGWEGERKKGV